MHESVGAWIIGEVIASGEFAEVRAARRADRDAVIKRLHPSAARGSELRALFAAEARLTCDLTPHPSLVRGLAYDLECESPYLICERIVGDNLRRRVDFGPVSRADAMTIIATVAAAAAHLHACGWVHGDLGPANIIVGEGGAVVCDLGVARSIGAGGPVCGTAAYMAPEQVRGTVWTAAVDLFALGTLAWELLTGARLFHRGPSYLSMAAVVESDAPPLADPQFADLVAAALAKEPRGRPSARDFAAAFARAQ
jgi:eukaryotic-like serine/threonine-protein kinase